LERGGTMDEYNSVFPLSTIYYKDTYMPIILGLSVDTSHARRVPPLSPTNIHSRVG